MLSIDRTLFVSTADFDTVKEKSQRGETANAEARLIKRFSCGLQDRELPSNLKRGRLYRLYESHLTRGSHGISPWRSLDSVCELIDIAKGAGKAFHYIFQSVTGGYKISVTQYDLLAERHIVAEEVKSKCQRQQKEK